MKTEKLQRKVIHVDEEFKTFIDKIESEGPFSGSAHHEIFMMALVLGFNDGKRKEIKKRLSGGFFREDTLTDDERALLCAIATADQNDLSIIKEENVDERYNIAEEYATRGFIILKDKLALSGTFQKKLELELREKLKEIKNIEF